jgi:hypothetical protein
MKIYDITRLQSRYDVRAIEFRALKPCRKNSREAAAEWSPGRNLGVKSSTS